MTNLQFPSMAIASSNSYGVSLPDAVRSAPCSTKTGGWHPGCQPDQPETGFAA